MSPKLDNGMYPISFVYSPKLDNGVYTLRLPRFARNDINEDDIKCGMTDKRNDE